MNYERIYQGDPSVLLSLLEKGRLQQEGKPSDHIRLLCIHTGGLKKGVFGAGVLQALIDLGLGRVFNRFLASSVAVPVTGYFMAGQSGSETIFYEESCEPGFVNWWRAQLDLDRICDVFDGVTGKGLDYDRALSGPTKLTIVMTDFVSGQAYYVEPKSRDEFRLAMKASMAVPALYTKPVVFDGRRRADGSLSVAVPIATAVRAHRPTHVLIIMNQSKEGHDEVSALESALLRYVPYLKRRHSKKFLEVVLERAKRSARSINLALRCRRIKVGVLWADKEPDAFCNDSMDLRWGFERARSQTHELLSGRFLAV